jgi:hypothetical protein
VRLEVNATRARTSRRGRGPRVSETRRVSECARGRGGRGCWRGDAVAIRGGPRCYLLESESAQRHFLASVVGFFLGGAENPD